MLKKINRKPPVKSFQNSENLGIVCFMPADINTHLRELLRDLRETLSTEIKGWLDPVDVDHRATVAKACIALANHGGGHVVIGLTKDGDGYREDDGRPDDLDNFHTDWVNEAVGRYAEPTFHCEVRHVESDALGRIFPVISVPGGHTVPITPKRSSPGERVIRVGAPYIRRPGPASEPPQTAKEWQELMRRCVVNGRSEMLDQLRAVLEGNRLPVVPAEKAEADELLRWRNQGVERWREETKGLEDIDPAKCRHGFWTASYQIHGEVIPPRPNQMVNTLRDAQIRHTGWPMWLVPGRQDIDPYLRGNEIECWVARDGEVLMNDPSHADFWRANTAGRLFLLRGYLEDGPDYAPGTIFSLTTPVWRVGECLLHAWNVSTLIAPRDDNVEIEVIIRWTGLQGRRLRSLDKRRNLADRWQSNEDFVETRGRFAVEGLPDLLPEAVRELTLPLYSSFGFFEPPAGLFADELSQMRRHQF